MALAPVLQQDPDPLDVLTRVRQRLSGAQEEPDPLEVLARIRRRSAEAAAPAAPRGSAFDLSAAPRVLEPLAPTPRGAEAAEFYRTERADIEAAAGGALRAPPLMSEEERRALARERRIAASPVSAVIEGVPQTVRDVLVTINRGLARVEPSAMPTAPLRGLAAGARRMGEEVVRAYEPMQEAERWARGVAREEMPIRAEISGLPRTVVEYEALAAVPGLAALKAAPRVVAPGRGALPAIGRIAQSALGGAAKLGAFSTVRAVATGAPTPEIMAAPAAGGRAGLVLGAAIPAAAEALPAALGAAREGWAAAVRRAGSLLAGKEVVQRLGPTNPLVTALRGDPYAVLGVDARTATPEAVEAAYRGGAMRWHPDRNPGDPLAAETFDLLGKAREMANADLASRRPWEAPVTGEDLLATRRAPRPGAQPAEPPARAEPTPAPVAPEPPTRPTPPARPAEQALPLEVPDMLRRPREPIEEVRPRVERGLMRPAEPTVTPPGEPAPEEVLARVRDRLGTEAAPVPHGEVTGRPLAPEALAERQRIEAEMAALAKEVPARATSVVMLPTAKIRTDPERFQFKTPRRLPGPWNPELGGIVQVWRDPADNEVYVVNGHTRLDLAQRDQVPEIEVRFLQAANAEEARRKGALTNIAEGQGTPVDVAKYLRESKATVEDLRAFGVPIERDLARQGLSLTNLAPDVFDQVATGKIPEEWGVGIGRQIPNDPDLQRQVLGVVRASGKRLSEQEVRDVASAVQAAETEDVIDGDDLFGTRSERKSLYVPRAQLLSSLRKILTADKRLFGPLLREGRVEELETAGSTRIDVEAATRRDQVSRRMEEIFNLVYTRAGPIAAQLTEGSRRIAHGEKPGTVARELAPVIRGAVADEIGRGAAALGRGLPRGAADVGVGAPPEAGASLEAAAVEGPPPVETAQAAMFGDVPSPKRRVSTLDIEGTMNLAIQRAAAEKRLLYVYPTARGLRIETQTPPATRYYVVDPKGRVIERLSAGPDQPTGGWRVVREGAGKAPPAATEPEAPPVPVEPTAGMRAAATELEGELGRAAPAFAGEFYVRTQKEHVVGYNARDATPHELGSGKALLLDEARAIQVARDLEAAGHKGVQVLRGGPLGEEIEWMWKGRETERAALRAEEDAADASLARRAQVPAAGLFGEEQLNAEIASELRRSFAFYQKELPKETGEGLVATVRNIRQTVRRFVERGVSENEPYLKSLTRLADESGVAVEAPRVEMEGTQAALPLEAPAPTESALERVERIATSELERLREEYRLQKDPKRRTDIARQIADRERLINRGKAIGAEELATRAVAEPLTEGPLAPPEQMVLLDADVGTGPMESRIAEVPIAQTTQTLRPISPVELVRLVRDVLGENRIFLKRYPQARGMFYAAEPAKIGLSPELGKDYEQFAKTLAHEIGHLVDYLPEGTLKRGNILGRIAVLRDYLKGTIDALPTEPSQALTPADRRKIRSAAEKAVGPRPPKDEEADLAAWQSEVAREYAERILDEVEMRHLIERQRVDEELRLLSWWWRPFDPETATASHLAYRESSKELYADALSVLLNSPGSLQARAPTFFDAFLGYLERKPDFAKLYDEIQTLLGQGDEAIYAARKADLKADFDFGEAVRKASEQSKEKQSWLGYLRQMFLTRGDPLVRAERARVGKGVPAASEAYEVKLALQEFNHADNVNRLMMMDIVRDAQKPLEEAAITQDQAGVYVMMQRIAEGDRGGLAEDAKAAIMDITGEDKWEAAKVAYTALGAETGGEVAEDSPFDADLLAQAETGLLNPRGYTPAEAKRMLADLERELGPEKFGKLQSIAVRYREILNEPFDEAVRIGVYSQEFGERMKKTEGTYWTYAVLDHFNGRVPAGMRRQVGTVKGVANPWTASALKAMALNRLNEYQKAKLAVLKNVDTDFPGEVGLERVIDRYHREAAPAAGRANLVYHVDGKLHYREMDAYIVNVLKQSDIGAAGRLARTLSSWTYGIFHPLYVSWSLAWQARNLPRDFKRTYKNLAAAHAGKPTYRQAIAAFTDIPKLLAAYAQTGGVAYRHARRRDDAFIRQMLQDRALGRAFHSFEPFEGSDTVERMAQRYGLLKPPHEGPKAVLMHLGRPIEVAGVMQETWTKAAAYKLLGDMGIKGRRRAYMTRNYVGTPDSTDRGLASDVANGLYLYSNVILAGWRADMEVGLNPTTASGYWFRGLLMDFLPKILMAAATLGWLGEEYEKWMGNVPSYDKEKYIIIPIPPFYSTTASGERKAVYLRLPHDDTNRVIAAATWAFLMDDRPYAPSRAIGILAGEFPGLNPGVDLVIKWAQFMTNRNPYDAFRGRSVVPTTEWEAGGWPRARSMLKYSLGDFGVASAAVDWLATLWGSGLQQGQPTEKTGAEWVIAHVPVVSSLVRVSDRGLTEERWWELDWENQQRARLRADLPNEVRRAVRKRNQLNRFGEDRLSDPERVERDKLNGWYRTYYLPITRDMEIFREAKNRDAYRDAIRRLDESLAAPAAGVGGLRRGPQRPRAPQRPSRP